MESGLEEPEEKPKALEVLVASRSRADSTVNAKVIQTNQYVSVAFP